jgi:hypothetical protein
VILSGGGILAVVAETRRIPPPDMILVFLLPPSCRFLAENDDFPAGNLRENEERQHWNVSENSTKYLISSLLMIAAESDEQ